MGSAEQLDALFTSTLAAPADQLAADVGVVAIILL